MNTDNATDIDDVFVSFAEEIAAQARQLLRAIQAEDPKAVEVTLHYFRSFLMQVLARHLRDAPRWDASGRWLDGLGDSTPEFPAIGRLKLRDELIWATRDQIHWYQEPFEFELQLSPETGEFRWYTFRFADNRLLAEKVFSSKSSALEHLGDSGWAFVFHQERKSEKGDSMETIM
jgi:hypothetical protein